MDKEGLELKNIEMKPIGFVSRVSPDENVRDRSLVARIVLNNDLASALDGIEERRSRQRLIGPQAVPFCIQAAVSTHLLLASDCIQDSYEGATYCS